MDRIKLKWKIFSFLLGFCGLLLLLLWLLQTVFLYDTYKYVRTREMERAVAYVEENINDPELMGLMEELRREKDIIVTPSNEFVPPEMPMREERGRPPQEAVTKTQVFELTDGRELSLTFHAIITPVDATVDALKMQLTIVTAIMILLAVAVAILLAKNISTPLENINRSAKILATGKYDVSFAGKGFLEMRELSDTLNAAAKELSKVEGLRRELLANVSHDLRTPLSLIYSYAEMMSDFPEEITPEQTKVIMDETTRLSSLVNDALDLSKLEEGMQELHLSRFDLTALLQKTTRRTAELVKKQGYSIRFEGAGDYMVRADEVKITQAYYNLLLNAINYAGPDKQVEVRQHASGGKVRVDVVDHGSGIAAEDLPYIWERYYKSDKSHRRAVTGSGLGLSIVRKVFERHGAAYGVDSTPGQGSAFWFEMDIET